MCAIGFTLDGPMTDRHGFTHSTTSVTAIAAFERAVSELAAHRPGTAPALTQALDADPDLLAAHLLRGFAGVIAARPGALTGARLAQKTAQSVLARRSPTAEERIHLDALDAAIDGHMVRAAEILDRLLTRRTDLLTLKLAVSLRFMTGGLAEMRAVTERGLELWQPGALGRGFALGCHAFSLGETGDQRAAEREGRAALLAEPRDAWGLHAVAHACEMLGRPEDGIAWVEASRPVWSVCGSFGQHVAWHLALFHLERRRFDRVLALYDTEIRATPSDEMRDVANAASLLWRLRQDGVDVGDRWEALAESARRCREETTLMFGTLHNLLTLVAVGDRAAAQDTLRAIAEAAENGTDQAPLARDIALPLGRALLGLSNTTPDLIARLQRLGGSHAQRDVFVRTLACLAAAAEDAATLDSVLAARHRLRRLDRFGRRFEARMRAVA